MHTILYEQLGVMQEEAFNRHLRYITSEPGSPRNHQAILDVGMLARVRYQLEAPSAYLSTITRFPLWLPSLRDDLRRFINDDPEYRHQLSDSVFFLENRYKERQIGSVVSGSIRPGGISSGEELAVGIIEGSVFAQPYSREKS